MRWLVRALAALIFLHGLGALLRPLHDRWGASTADLDRALPGDDRIVHVDSVTTRAVTIAAPPAAVWPWLVQLGAGRAGWYAFDIVDNLGRPSAEHLLGEHQRLAPGDVIPSGPRGTGFRVLEVQPEHHLLLAAPGLGSTGTWCFFLDPQPDGRTRLIERLRGRSEWWSPMRWLGAEADLLDLVMMRRHLLGIKARAERHARAEASIQRGF